MSAALAIGWRGTRRRVRRARVANVSVAAFALGLAWGMKSFYSRAGFDDLVWVLGPTTWLVERLTGAAFEIESGVAYLCRERLYAIAPSCAGVNFMIAAFVSLACGLVHARATVRGRLALVAASAVVAYAVTLVANAVRIAIALRMPGAPESFGPLGAERLHEVQGIVVYFLFLCATFAIAARLVGARRELAW